MRRSSHVVRHALFVSAAAILAVFAIAALPIGDRVAEAQDSQKISFEPTRCDGWRNATRAEDISLGVSADREQFSDKNAASLVSTSTKGSGGTSDIATPDGAMTCGAWKAAGSSQVGAGAVSDAVAFVSFAGRGPTNGTDVVVVRYSLNGSDWNTGTTFILRDVISNARNAGYAKFSVDASSVADLSRLVVQIFGDFVPSGETSEFFVDGLRVDATVQAPREGAAHRIRAGSCSGWSNADAAREIQARPSSSYDDFRPAQSAVLTVPAGSSSGTFGMSGEALACGDYALLRSTVSDDIVAKRMVVSLAGQVAADGSTALLPSYSTDGGDTWQSLDTIPIAGTVSNASHEGYWVVPLPDELTREELAAMHFRVMMLPSADKGIQKVLVDGIELELDLARRKDKGTFNPLSFLTQRSFLPIEVPTVTLEVDSVRSVSVADANGKPVDVAVATSKRRIAGVDRTTIELRSPSGDRAMAPGAYTVTIRANAGGRQVVETQSFSWGVLTLDTPKSSYRVGEDVPLSIGAVDDKGKTVCDADLTLTIVSPGGGRSVAKTSDGRIVRSKECGPESLTSVPDYLARFKATETGTYGLTLSAATTSGVREVSAAVTVLGAAPFVIERVAPSRINPKSPYKVHLFVKAEKDFNGTVEEVVPSDFVVTGMTPEAALIDRGGSRLMTWDVALEAGHELELTYEFDAPDVSPALFTIGPATVAKQTSTSQWQIASDEVVEKDAAGLAYHPIASDEEDWTSARRTFAESTSGVYAAQDEAVVKLWKDGFTGARGGPVKLTDVTVIPPTDGPSPVDKVEERFTKQGKALGVLYLVPNKNFRPGVYRVRGTVSDGTTTRSEEAVFEWGTFDLALADDAYPVHSRVDVAFSDLDAEGNVECDNGLTLEVQAPSGTNERYVLGEGTIDQPVACGKAAGETQLRAHFLPTEEGTYRVTLARSTGAVRERVKDFTVVSRPKTPDDVAKGARDAVTIAGTAAFKADERPGIDVTLKEGGGLFGGTAVTRSVSAVQILDPKGKKFTLDLAPKERQQHGTTVASYEIDTSKFTRPGKYTATVVVNQGEYAEPVTKDFTWGVIALNVTRAIARPGDDQTIGMGVLDDAGRTICDATIALKVTDPNGTATDFSTSDGTIRLSGVCVDKGVTNLPDYFVTMKPTVAGQYRLHMEASTRAGTRTYDDAFRVQEGLDFAVERLDFPTRIFPPAPYPVRMAVTPSRDYQGTVREAAPADFVLTGAKPDALVVPSAADPAIQYLQWTVDWKKGETYELGYTFDAPDVSPELFTLGPLEIVGQSEQPLFAEPRRWQLASDAVNIRVAGTLYSNEGTTAIDCSAANKTVKLEVNNTASYNTTCTLAAGTYDFGTTISVNGSDVLTVYISGATEKGSRTTRVAATPADITGADIYQNRAIVSHEDSGPITNTNLDNWDSGNDSDVPYTVTGGALTVASGRKLIVWTGKTFTPGGAVTTTAASNQSNPDGDLDIQASATLSMGTNALSVGGDYNNAGTFSKSSGQTTTFTGTTTGFTIAPGTGNFDSVTFNGSGGGWSNSAAMSVDGSLTMTNGTLSGTNNVTVTANAIGTNGIINLTGGTFKQRMNASSQNFGTSTGSNTWTFYNLTLSNAGSGIRNSSVQTGGTGDITITNVLTLGEVGDSFATGLWAGNRNYNLTGAGSPFVMNAGGTLFGQTSTFIYSGSPSNVTIGPSGGYNNITIGLNDANSVTYVVSASSFGAAGTTTVSTGDTLTCNASCSIGSSSTGAGTLVINGTINGSNVMYYYSNTPFPISSNFNLSLWMRGEATGSQELTAGTYQQAVQLYCGCAETIKFGAGTFNFQSTLRIAEVSNGVNYTVDAATNDPTVNITSDLDFNGNSGTTGVEILNAGAGTWTVTGTVDFKDSGGQAGQYNAETNNLLKMNGTSRSITTGGNTLYDFEVSAGSTTATDAMTVSNNLTVSGGTFTGPASGTISLGGNFSSSGTFTHNSGTVTMTGTSKTIGGSSNTTFNNLTISGTVTVTASNPVVNTVLQVDTSKSLTINSGLTVALARNNASDSLTLNGTINGPGRLTYRNATANSFTTSGALGAGLIVRFDTVNGNLTIPARTDYGAIEAYGGSANARTVTLGTAALQTITTSSYFYVMADAVSPNNVTVSATTNNPTMNLGGDLDFTGTGTASEIIQSGTGTWTVSGSVIFTGGTYTATSGTTLAMNGTSKTLTSASQNLYNFTVSGGSVTVGDTTAITNDLSVTGGTMSGTSNITVNGNATGTAGVVNLTGGTFEQRVSSGKNFGPTTASTSWTFSTLTFSNSNGGATPITVTAQSCSTCGVTVSGVLNIGKSGDAAGATTTLDAGDKTWTLSGTGTPLVLLSSPAAVFTKATSTVAYTGNGATTVTPLQYYGLTIGISDGNSNTYTISAAAATNTCATGSSSTTNTQVCGGVLTVAAGDTFTITGQTVDLASNSTLTLDGTITGTGTFEYYSSAEFPTTGTVSITTLNWLPYYNDLIVSPRTYSSDMRMLNTSGTNRVVYLGAVSESGSVTVSGSNKRIVLFANNTGDLTLDNTRNNWNITIGSDMQAAGSGSGTEHFVTGTGTWSVAGNFTMLTGTLTQSSGATIQMTGTGKTLTSAGNTLPNVTLTGTITLADATHTVAGNLTVSNTLTAGTSTVVMNGTGTTIDGGGQTLNNLTISNNVSVANSDVTVSSTLQIDNTMAFTIGSGRTVTLSSTGAGALTLNGTLNGPGRLTYRSSTAFPTTGTLASTLILRYDLVTNDMTTAVRTDYGTIEAFNSSSSRNGVLTVGNGAHTLAGNFDLQTTGTSTLTVSNDTNNAAMNVSGSVTASTANGAITLSAGSNTWSVSGNVNLTNVTTFNHNSGTLTMNGTGTLTSNGKTLNNLTTSGSGTVTLANATHTLAGNLNLGASVTIAAGTSTVAMTGTTKTIDGGGKTLTNLTISGDTTLQNTDMTVSGTLAVDDTKTLTLNPSRTLTLSGNSGTTLNLNTSGTVAGSGTLAYQNSATTVTTAGTLSSAFTFDLVNGNETIPSRTFGGLVTGLNSTSSARTLQFGVAVTPTFSGGLDLKTTGTGTLLADGATNNPTTVTITGNLTTSAANGAVTLSMGSGTWSVSGNADLTNVTTFNHNSGTLTMNGTGTLTSNGKTLNNLTTSGSGTVTLANATHTLAGNLNLGASVTIAAGTSTVAMTGTTKTIDGGGKTLTNLTISGDTTLQNTDMTVSGTLQVDNTKTLTINVSRLLTHSGATLTLNGTIAGSGTYAYQSATAFPTSGTISSILRMDATNNDQSMSQRTYAGQVELYSNSGSAVRTITLGTAGSQTLTFSSNFYVVAANTRDIIVAGDTNNPNLSITGNVDFTGSGNGYEVVAAGSGTWTVAGSVNLTNGIYGPSVTSLTPSNANTAQRYQAIIFDLGCASNTTYSCLGNGTLSYGNTDDGGDCVNFNQDQNLYTHRAWMQYNPTGIDDTATIIGAQVGTAVTATFSAAFNVARSTVDDLASQSCTTSGGTYSKIAGSEYGTVDLSTLGNHVIQLGPTGVADVQSRITGTTARLSIGLNNTTYETTMGTMSASPNNYPVLYATYTTGSTSTLTMTGAGTTLTSGGNTLYNVNLTSTITLANETLYVAGDLNLTSGDLTPGTSTVYMTGAGKTLTAPAAGDTLYNLTVDPSSAGTVTLAAGGGDLTVSNALSVASGDTLSIGSARTLTLSGASGITLTLTGTISGAGRLAYQNTATAFPATGTISSILRMDATNGNQTVGGTNSATRTFGGVVEIYNNSSTTARTVTLENGTARTFTFASHLYLIAANTRNITLTADTTTDPTVNVTGDIDFTGTGSGSEAITSGSGVWTASANVDFTGGTYTATSGNELKMNGTGNLVGNSQSLYKLTIDGNGNTVTLSANVTVTNALTIGGASDGNNDTLTVNGGFLTSTSTGSVVFGGSGTDTVNGNGILILRNDTVDTDGTFGGTLTIRYDTYQGVSGLNVVARQYTILVIDNSFTEVGDTVTLGTGAGQTITVDNNISIDCSGCEFAATPNTINGDTFDPTVTVAGSVLTTDELGQGGYTISMGSGTWTVGGDFDLTYAGTFSHNSGTLLMNGTGTLTSNGKTLNNLQINSSGTVTLPAATHTLAGNLLLGGSGTPTVTGSTVVMNGTTKTIDGGAKTLNNLTISGTVTLQNSNLTVAGTLQIDNTKTLTINNGLSLTHTGSTLTLTGTIDGQGTYVYQSATTFPASGTISSGLRMDATNSNQALSARTYGGAVELYSNSANVRTITLGTATSQTLTFSSNLSVNAANTADVRMEGSTYHPTVNLTGDFQSTGTGNGTEILILGDGTWTVSGNVNVTSSFLAIRYAELNPSWDTTGYKNENYIDDGQGGCMLDSTTYSCETSTATTMSVGNDLQAGGGQGCPATDRYNRAYLKYDLSSIANTNTVILARQRIYPASVGVTPTIGHANNESPDGVACNSLYDVGVASAYNSWSPWTAGQNTETSIPVTDIQSRLGTTSFAEVIDSGATPSTVNTTDNASNKPLLRLAYVAPSTTPTFVMNGASKTLTVSVAGFYNLTLSGTITVGATSTTYLYGTLDMTGGTITNNTWPLVMAGSTTTIKGGGNTLGNLTVSANTSATLTGSDLGLSLNLAVNSGATLTIDNGRILTDGAATTTNIVGTIAANGSGLMVFTSASTGPGTGGTLSAPVRFDATAGNVTSGIFDARTYGGAVELYSNSSSDRTVSTASGGTYVFSSSFTTTRASTGGLTFDMNTTDPASLTISGATTVGAGTTVSANSSGTFAMNGSYTNNGTFTHNSGTVTLAGSGQQTLSGTLTGAGGQFNNLTITNSSGTDPDSSPSVIFAGAAATAATFKAGDAGTPAPNVKLRFNAESTYTFQNISLHGGAAGTKVFLRSSSSGTQWNLNVAGTRSPISYVNVRDSNACGQPPDIDASDGTNVSEANNNCWRIATLQVSLSANSLNLGTLSPSTVTKGSITSTVTSSAPNGYISFVKYDHTLTAGSFTIPDAGGSITQGTAGYGASTSKAAQTIAQTTGACTSGSGTFNASSLSTSFQSFASASSTVSGDATTLCILATPSISTAAGSYSSTATIVTTARF